jgi:hypothetical protein
VLNRAPMDAATASEDGDTQRSGEAARGSLAEAQIDAIEAAFAEHGRLIGKLRREIEELSSGRDAPIDAGSAAIEDRLEAIETKLEQHDQALRHMLERLIAFFENSQPAA